ncbi:MAG TPA: formyltransferase family protein, partial [Candidatus Thermoplasmatota archaeon]|nr:formyltransferase family protein [Candidatus Thermoplasmatota archaeon]
GVVARITSYLFEQGANIEAIEERVRRGQFHMLLQASWRGKVDEKRMARGLAALGEELGMEVRFRVHHPGARAPPGSAAPSSRGWRCGAARSITSGDLALEPVLVASNQKVLAPLAQRLGLPFHHVPWTQPDKAEARLLRLLDKSDVDLIVLARFMRILSPGFVWKYPNRIVNVHPSLLPAFPGASAYRQAWEHGVRVAGVTAHFVTPDLDQGPILAQKAFPIPRGATVEEIRARGQEAESEVLVEALQLCLREDLDVHWGRVW